MICNESINSILPLVEELNSRKLLIEASDDTIVGVLVQSSTTPQLYNPDNKDTWCDDWRASLTCDQPIGSIGDATMSSDTDHVLFLPTTVHSNTIDEAVKLLSDSVHRAMDHARNVARPIISEALDELESLYNDSQVTREPYEIGDVAISPVWTDSIVSSVLSKFDAVDNIPQISRENIPKIYAPETLNNTVRCGSARVDGLITDLMSELDVTWADVFNSIFSGHGSLGIWPAREYLERNMIILQFFLADHLTSNPVQDSGMNMVDWRTAMIRITTSLGVMCNRLYHNNQSIENAKQLLLDIVDGCIYVNGNVYDQWLNAGGTPEVIFGAVMTDPTGKLVDYNIMLNESTRFKSAWSVWHSVKRNKDQNLNDERLRNSMVSVVVSAIEALDTDFYGPEDTKAAMLVRAKAEISKYRVYDTKDLGNTLTSLICRTMFAHTSAERLLTAMSYYLNEGYSATDAENATALDYITDYVAGSLNIHRL